MHWSQRNLSIRWHRRMDNLWFNHKLQAWQICNGGSCATDAICPTSIIDINALTPIYLGDNAVIDVNVSQARTVTLKIMNPLTRKVLDEFISPSNIYFSYTGFKPETIGTYKAIATIEDTVANPCDICSAEVFFTVVKSGQSMAVPETDIVLVAIVGLLVVAIARVKRN